MTTAVQDAGVGEASHQAGQVPMTLLAASIGPCLIQQINMGVIQSGESEAII